MSKTTSEYLGLEIRDNNEFVSTEVDAENFRKIDKETKRLNDGTICFAECTSTVNSEGKTRVHSITRPEKKSALILFQIDGLYTPKDTVKIDEKTVTVKAISSGAESFENIITYGAPTLGFYDESNSVLYVISANPIISDGMSQYTFGVDGIKNLPTFTDKTTGQTKIIEGHEDYTFVVTNSEDVSIVGSDLAISKVGPMMFFGGLISVKYTGAQKTLLQLAKSDGTVDGINVCHGGNNAIFFASLNDKKIARLSWVKSADGQSVSLVLSWIFDLATGQLASNATYTIAIDSQYFAGY